MRSFANAFLIAFAIDALLRVASSQLSGGPELSWVVGSAAALTGLLVLASLPIFVLMGMRPALRWRIFLPPCLYLSWIAMGAMPLPIWFSGSGALLVAGALEAVCAGTAFAFCRQQNGGKGWLLDEASLRGPGFSGRTALGFTALNLLVILPASLAYLAASAAGGIGYLTEGFVEIRSDGVHLAHREYVRGDQTIHLVAMMHIGESDFYEELAEALPGKGSITLAEGVTDETGLMPEGLFYGNVATGLGLVEQPAFGSGEGEGGEVRYADVDLGEFSPETLEFLKGVARIWNSKTVADALIVYVGIVKMSSEKAERTVAALRHDLIELRNDRVLAEIERSLPDYDTVVVPWGALHLPGIQQRIRELGFVQEAATDRRVVRW